MQMQISTNALRVYLQEDLLRRRLFPKLQYCLPSNGEIVGDQPFTECFSVSGSELADNEDEYASDAPSSKNVMPEAYTCHHHHHRHLAGAVGRTWASLVVAHLRKPFLRITSPISTTL